MSVTCLSVCTTCNWSRTTVEREGRRGGAELLEQIQLLWRPGSEMAAVIRPVRCMSACTRACTVAMSGPDRFTLLFGDLDPATAATDVLTTFAAYQARKDGFLRRDERAPAMREGILARVPPASWFHPDGVVP